MHKEFVPVMQTVNATLCLNFPDFRKRSVKLFVSIIKFLEYHAICIEYNSKTLVVMGWWNLCMWPAVSFSL